MFEYLTAGFRFRFAALLILFSSDDVDGRLGDSCGRSCRCERGSFPAYKVDYNIEKLNKKIFIPPLAVDDFGGRAVTDTFGCIEFMDEIVEASPFLTEPCV